MAQFSQAVLRRYESYVTLSRLALNSAACVLSWPVARYITGQRDRLEHRSTVLPDVTKARFRDYVSSVDLKRVRIVESDPLPIRDPPFSRELRRIGLDFPSPALTAAITFDHVIVSREPMSPRLLFHELVHVVQYGLLGVSAFAHLYVRGFLRTRTYKLIPLERCAFELEQRFATDERSFSLESEVSAWIEGQLF